MKIITVVLFCLIYMSAYAQDCPKVLFVIEKSTNDWIVVYEANMSGDKFTDEDPLEMYWQKKGTDKQSELGWLETKLAYGVKYSNEVPGESYNFSVAAVPEKTVLLSIQNGCPIVTAEINGEQAVLNTVFVELTGISNVKHIDLTGTSANGSVVTERLAN